MPTIDQHLLSLSDAELNDLPQGIIRLDLSGKIVFYSKSQAKAAGRTVSGSTGLNFFTHVAPCTAVQAFQGKFVEFVSKPGASIETFDFVFAFASGPQRVQISFLRQAINSDTVCIVVNYNPIT